MSKIQNTPSELISLGNSAVTALTDIEDRERQTEILRRYALDSLSVLCREILPVGETFSLHAPEPLGGGTLSIPAPANGWPAGARATVCDPVSVFTNSRGDVRYSMIVRVGAVRFMASGLIVEGTDRNKNEKLLGLASRAAGAAQRRAAQ